MIEHEWKEITHLSSGTVFLQFQGPTNCLGVVTHYDPGDRMGGRVTVRYEDGCLREYLDGYGNPKVFVIDRIDLGLNPLRDLLNWRAYYEK